MNLIERLIHSREKIKNAQAIRTSRLQLIDFNNQEVVTFFFVSNSTSLIQSLPVFQLDRTYCLMKQRSVDDIDPRPEQAGIEQGLATKRNDCGTYTDYTILNEVSVSVISTDLCLRSEAYHKYTYPNMYEGRIIKHESSVSVISESPLFELNYKNVTRQDSIEFKMET